jgi:hypothetical protein
VAIFRANSRTSFAANAVSLIVDGHDFAFDIVIFIVFDELSLFIQSQQRQDIATADFEAFATANTLIFVDRLNKFWFPI